MQCEMIIGYLVPHRCPNRGLADCVRCGRRYCDEHVTLEPEGVLCLACQQGRTQPVLVAPPGARVFTDEDIALFEVSGLLDEMDETFADLS